MTKNVLFKILINKRYRKNLSKKVIDFIFLLSLPQQTYNFILLTIFLKTKLHETSIYFLAFIFSLYSQIEKNLTVCTRIVITIFDAECVLFQYVRFKCLTTIRKQIPNIFYSLFNKIRK